MLAQRHAALLPSLPRRRHEKLRSSSATPRRLRQGRARDGAAPAVVVVAPFAAATSDVASTPSTTTSSSSPAASIAAIAEAKAALREASPAARKGDAAAVAAVVAAVEKLSALALEKQRQRAEAPSSPSSPAPLLPVFPAPTEPSTWETLYTDSKVGSNGKFGPLQGEARQLFISSASGERGDGGDGEKGTKASVGGGRFINRVAFPTVSLPILKADFSGSWFPKPGRDDRVEVIFEETAFYVAGLRVGGGEFPPPPEKGSVKGHWVMRYADDDVRAFLTNKMSLVVLGRVIGE